MQIIAKPEALTFARQVAPGALVSRPWPWRTSSTRAWQCVRHAPANRARMREGRVDCRCWRACHGLLNPMRLFGMFSRSSCGGAEKMGCAKRDIDASLETRRRSWAMQLGRCSMARTWKLLLEICLMCRMLALPLRPCLHGYSNILGGIRSEW